jgi:hypothetical protein
VSPTEAERLRAALRFLLDTGEITPKGASEIDRIIAEVSW